MTTKVHMCVGGVWVREGGHDHQGTHGGVWVREGGHDHQGTHVGVWVREGGHDHQGTHVGVWVREGGHDHQGTHVGVWVREGGHDHQGTHVGGVGEGGRSRPPRYTYSFFDSLVAHHDDNRRVSNGCTQRVSV